MRLIISVPGRCILHYFICYLQSPSTPAAMSSPFSCVNMYLSSHRITNFTVSSTLIILFPPFILDKYILATSRLQFNAQIIVNNFLHHLSISLSNLLHLPVLLLILITVTVFSPFIVLFGTVIPSLLAIFLFFIVNVAQFSTPNLSLCRCYPCTV